MDYYLHDEERSPIKTIHGDWVKREDVEELEKKIEDALKYWIPKTDRERVIKETFGRLFNL